MRFLSPEWHDRLPSTNTVLLERLRTGEAPAPGFVLAARDQTAGRGRYERTWVGSGGQNLTFSFLLVTQQEGAHLASVPMAVALVGERADVRIYQSEAGGWEYPQAVAGKLGWGEKRVQVRLVKE